MVWFQLLLMEILSSLVSKISTPSYCRSTILHDLLGAIVYLLFGVFAESRAISQYVAHQYASKGTQLGAAGNGYATILVWQEVESHQFDPSASKLVWEQVFKPVFGLPTDAALVAETEVTLGKVLDVYEARLSQSKYLAGDSFTLADLHHLPNIQALLGTPSKKLFDSRPHVSAWVASITGRPAWGKVLALLPK